MMAAPAAHGPSEWIASYGYWAVLLGVFVTSFYSFRLLYLTFHGKERFREAHADHAHASHADAHHDHAHDAHGHDDHGHGAHEPHESPWVVTVPLVLLAIPSIAIGFLTIGPMLFGTDWKGHAEVAAIPGQALTFFSGAIDFLDPTRDTVMALKEEFHGPVAFALHGIKALPFWLALAGFLAATGLYLFASPELPARMRHSRVGAWPDPRILDKKYWMDDAVDRRLRRRRRGPGQSFQRHRRQG